MSGGRDAGGPSTAGSVLARALAGLDALSRASGYVAAVLVVGIAALILTEIFCRTVLNVSLSFAWEYSAYFLAASIFLAAGFTLRTGGHVRVMLLSQNVPPRAAHHLDLLATAAGTAAAGWIAWSLAAFAWQSWATGSTSATIDETPLVYPQAAMAFGAALLTLQLAARMIRLLAGDAPEDDEARRDFGVG